MHQDVFSRSICGEGFPDFYAQQAYGKRASCLNPAIDQLLKPKFEELGFCVNMDWLGYRKDENGWPLIEDCLTKMFAWYYTTAQSQQAFDALWKNRNGITDKFIAYWDHTSAAFANNPYVVGYDPLNEPFPGNFLGGKDGLKQLIGGNTDKYRLAPVFSKLYDVY